MTRRLRALLFAVCAASLGACGDGRSVLTGDAGADASTLSADVAADVAAPSDVVDAAPALDVAAPSDALDAAPPADVAADGGDAGAEASVPVDAAADAGVVDAGGFDAPPPDVVLADAPPLDVPPADVPRADVPPVDAPWEQPLHATDLPTEQVNPGTDATRSWMFADLFRASEGWILPHSGAAWTPTQADALATTVSLDARGWPTALPTNSEIQIFGSYATGEAVDPANGHTETTYLHGVFVLTWNGSGDLFLLPSINDGHGMRTLLSTPNRIVAVMDTPFKFEVLRLTRSDPSNPVRDVRLWAPVRDGAGLELTAASDLAPGHIAGSLEPAPGAPEPLFHPVFLSHLREASAAGVLRFLGWLNINGITDATPVAWADRADPDAAVRSLSVIDQGWSRHAVPGFRTRVGYPYEWILALCNAVGSDCWLQVPHTASDDLVTNLAELTARTLRPDLRAWVEFSNELWNSASPYLPQRTAATAVAAAHFGVDASAVSTAQLAWGVGQLQGGFLRTFERRWRELGQSDARLVNVVAGFAAIASYNDAVLASVREIDPNLGEVLAVSNYFGYGTQGDIFHRYACGSTPGVGPASLYDDTAAIVRRDLWSTAEPWTQNGAVARAAGVPLVSYEGGQHMLPLGYGDWSDPVDTDFMNFMYAFQRSPQMGALYREQYALFSAAGGRTPSLFMDLGTWSFWGYWGAEEYVTQTRAQSAKWDAFLSWGERQAGVRAPYDAVGTRPVLRAATLRGEAGTPLDVALAADGGDGAVVLSVLAGSLPPGVSLVPGASGTARLVGTPTAPGRFRAVLRALDRDGDPDDRGYTVDVDPQGTRDQSLFVFRGADLPASTLASGMPNGRYDPMRRTQTLDGGQRLCVPFSIADGDALFAAEFVGTQHLLPTSPLTFYGGWCVTGLPGGGRSAPPNLNAWVGLRTGQFVSWTGDFNGPLSFDAMLLWRRDQFTADAGTGAYAFASDPTHGTLQVDLTSLVADGTNVIRFVVVTHEAAGDAWYVSEAAYTDAYLGDGFFRLQDFVGNAAAGHRWAPIPAPSGTSVAVDPTTLHFAATTFDDVRAVGLLYRGTRWQWNFSFAFDRVFALGARR